MASKSTEESGDKAPQPTTRGKAKEKRKRSSQRGATKAARKRAAGLVDPSLHVVVKDELRVQILSVAIQRLYIPSEFAKDAGIPVNVASSHFRVLNEHGFLELAEVIPVRGANKHMYRATKSGFISDANWGTVAEALRPGVAGPSLPTSGETPMIQELLNPEGVNGAPDVVDGEERSRRPRSAASRRRAQ